MEKQYKALLLNGSPHAAGCTYTALRAVGEAFHFSRGSLLVLGDTVCWGLENNCTR